MISNLYQRLFVGASKSLQSSMARALVLTILLSIGSPLAIAQAPTTCTVSGTLYNPDATAAVGAQVRLSRVSKNGVLIAPGPFTYTANASGLVTFNVIRGTTAYIYSTVAPFNVVGGVAVSIPNTATADLSTLATVASVPTAGINVTTLPSKAGTFTFNASHFTVSEPAAGVANIALLIATPLSDSMTTRGDIIVRNASNVTARLPLGVANTVPFSDGTDLAYGQVTNSMLAGSIAYSKLSLTGAILNADLAGSIAYSKLSLTGAILNADLAGSIADSKLSTISTAGKVSDSALSSNIPLLNGANIFSPSTRSSGVAPYLTINAPADTGQTAGAESPGIKWVGADRRHATGALGTNREWWFGSPTYSFVGSSTATEVATVAIDGPPIVGANATFTSAFGLWVGNSTDHMAVPNQVSPFSGGILSGANYAVNGAGNIFQVVGWAINSGTRPVVGVGGFANTTGGGYAAGGNFVGYVNTASATNAHGIEVDTGKLVASAGSTAISILSATYGGNGATAHLWMQTGSAGSEATDGIVFQKTGGLQPVTGALITTSGSPSVVNGINFAGATFSSSAISTPGFTVDGSGNTTAPLFNATAAFRIGGLAPSRHFIVGNGTNYVDGTIGQSDVANLGLVLISTQSVAAVGTVDFTGLDSTYDSYVIVIDNAAPSADDAEFRIRVGTGGTPTWQSGGSAYIYGMQTVDSGGTSAGDGSTADSSIRVSKGTSVSVAVGNGAGKGWSGQVKFHQPAASAYCTLTYDGAYNRAAAGVNITRIAGAGQYDTSGAITALRFFYHTGNVTGRFTLYGYRKT